MDEEIRRKAMDEDGQQRLVRIERKVNDIGEIIVMACCFAFMVLMYRAVAPDLSEPWKSIWGIVCLIGFFVGKTQIMEKFHKQD